MVAKTNLDGESTQQKEDTVKMESRQAGGRKGRVAKGKDTKEGLKRMTEAGLPKKSGVTKAAKKIKLEKQTTSKSTLPARTLQSVDPEADTGDDAALNYASQAYWEERYAKGEDVSREFEWFLSFADVEPLLRKCISFKDRTTMFIDLGCGTSFFLRDLKESGFMGHCIGLDYSAKAIASMKRRKDCEGINFKVCDAREMDTVVRGASIVLDKSLMDTMLHAGDDSMVVEMLQSVARSLRPDGKFISITQLDPRKSDDLKFLQETVLQNLRSSYQSVASVTVHLSEGIPDAPPVPSVIVYNFAAGGGKDDVEMDIIEYESSEDGASTE